MLPGLWPAHASLTRREVTVSRRFTLCRLSHRRRVTWALPVAPSGRCRSKWAHCRPNSTSVCNRCLTRAAVVADTTCVSARVVMCDFDRVPSCVVQATLDAAEVQENRELAHKQTHRADGLQRMLDDAREKAAQAEAELRLVSCRQACTSPPSLQPILTWGTICACCALCVATRAGCKHS